MGIVFEEDHLSQCERKQHNQLNPKNAFDYLIAAVFYENNTHFRRIPSSELEKLDYFGLGGKTALAPHSNIIGSAAAYNAPNKWTADYRLPLVLGHVAWSEVQRVDRVDGVLLPSLRLPHSLCSPSLSSRIAEGDFAPLISFELF